MGKKKYCSFEIPLNQNYNKKDKLYNYLREVIIE